MSVAPANTASVLVVVSGVVQDPSTYSVSGTTLTFSAAPPSGTSNISARYLGIPASGVTTTAYRTKTEFTATAGQTTFTPPSYTVGYIDVFLNGVLLGSADYTATNGTTVVLTTGAAAGNLVTIESFYVSSVLSAIPNTAGIINLTGPLVSGTLPTGNGGTGTTSFPAPGTSGNVLTSNGSAWTSATSTPSLGVGQSWQDVTSSRAGGTNYTNSTGRTIMVCINFNTGTSGAMTVNGVLAGIGASTVSQATGGLTTAVPSGAVYNYVGGAALLTWTELR